MANWTNDPDNPDRHLIVLSAPHQRHPKYRRHFEAIIDFDIRLARAIMGHDNVIVLARPQEMPFLRGALPDDVLLPADVSDIWIRDFAPVLTTKMVQFVYRPRYLKKWEADEARESFALFCRRYGLEFEKSKLALDGGNLVSNHKDMAVVTERVLADNSDWTRNEIISELKEKLALEHLAIISEEPRDATGHADGMLLWLTEGTVGLRSFPEPLNARLNDHLVRDLPGVRRPSIPQLLRPQSRGRKRRFASAWGLNINAIVTQSCIYVPSFGPPCDGLFLEAAAHTTDKSLRLVAADSVCEYGGSARCLSWQIMGRIAERLIAAARAR